MLALNGEIHTVIVDAMKDAQASDETEAGSFPWCKVEETYSSGVHSNQLLRGDLPRIPVEE